MFSKYKNIIIVVVIVIAAALVYVFFFRGSTVDQGSITSSLGTTTPQATPGEDLNKPIDSDFLNLLLNIQSLKLDISIFTSDVYLGLRDSSIVLTQDNTEGRQNPFAPIGSDTSVMPTSPDIATFGSLSGGTNNTASGGNQSPSSKKTGGN